MWRQISENNKMTAVMHSKRLGKSSDFSTHTSVRECTCSRFCYANCKKFITVTSQAKIITLKKIQAAACGFLKLNMCV